MTSSGLTKDLSVVCRAAWWVSVTKPMETRRGGRGFPWSIRQGPRCVRVHCLLIPWGERSSAHQHGPLLSAICPSGTGLGLGGGLKVGGRARGRRVKWELDGARAQKLRGKKTRGQAGRDLHPTLGQWLPWSHLAFPRFSFHQKWDKHQQRSDRAEGDGNEQVQRLL